MIENTNGGQVTIINPPFEVKKPKPKKWIKKWHAFGLFFAVSNGRLKKRDEIRDHWSGNVGSYNTAKRSVFEKQHHRCPECGKEFQRYKDMEAHHALPWARFPELRQKAENLVLLCHDCHKEVHCNPWKNIKMMQDKAQELGIDLKQRYDHDNRA